MVKFADDSGLLSLLLGTQNRHGPALDDFIEWCDESYLDLNVNKTKGIIVDFRRPWHTHTAIQIHDEKVEIVHLYKYLGTIFENTLKWDRNTEAITKKGHQRLLLRKLKSLNVDPTILKLFYN